MNTMEILDDIENLLFLCDRLNTRLAQVTSYVDEVKQTWINKRRSMEIDSSISPLIAQKAIKCNKVLLNVAEKLAVVELQTESLHHLHSSLTNPLIINLEKPQSLAAVINHFSGSKPEINRVQRESMPSATTSINGGMSTFTARSNPTLLRETNPTKAPTIEQQQQSAFHRPLSVQDTTLPNQAMKVTSRLPQYQLSTKLTSNGHSTDPFASK